MLFINVKVFAYVPSESPEIAGIVFEHNNEVFKTGDTFFVKLKINNVDSKVYNKCQVEFCNSSIPNEYFYFYVYCVYDDASGFYIGQSVPLDKEKNAEVKYRPGRVFLNSDEQGLKFVGSFSSSSGISFTYSDNCFSGLHIGGTATCKRRAICNVCGSSYGSLATNHNEVSDEAVSATCTKTGLTEGKHCSVCNKVLVAQEIVKANGHTIVIDKAVEATETSTGLTEGSHCSVCNSVLIAQKIIPMLEKKPTTTHQGGVTNLGNPAEDKVVKTEAVKVSKVSYTVTTTASGVMAAEYKAPAKKTETSVIIPDTIKVNGKTVKVTSIATNAFKKNTKLKKVVIGKNVQKIGENAFYGCTRLATVTFKSPALTMIDAKAFYGCKVLKKVTVPNSVTEIGSGAFAKCTKLKTVTLGKNLITIGSSAFSSCQTLTKIVIPAKVTKIGGSAFSGCIKLKTVSLGANVVSIGDKAFYKCTVLSKLTIPAKVENIGKQAFYGSKKLKSLTIKTTKLTSKSIGKDAFKGIYSKPTVSVPKSKLNDYKSMLVAKGMPKKAKIK